MPSVSFLFPSAGCNLSGGLKVIYEYANRLSADGCEVHIVYAGSIFWSKKSLRYKLSGIVRYIQRLCEGYSCRRWFALDRRVKEHLALSLSYRHVPKSDIYVASSPYTAMYLNDYPIRNTQKYYFIQDYENWGGLSDRDLRATYHFEMNKIVVSSWLKRIIDQEGVTCKMIPNGFDPNDFGITIPIKKKDRYRITMLYHVMERKGCKYGFEAIEIVKKKYPQLSVNLFGTDERPDNLPQWYNYYQSPDKESLRAIYNDSAIYLGCSNIEGWGLTIGEAMMCGCAVVCTDNDGYKEMAIDAETALLSPIRDSQGLTDNMIRLMEDDELRHRIAENGNIFIQQFSWDKSYILFRKALNI